MTSLSNPTSPICFLLFFWTSTRRVPCCRCSPSVGTSRPLNVACCRCWLWSCMCPAGRVPKSVTSGWCLQVLCLFGHVDLHEFLILQLFSWVMNVLGGCRRDVCDVVGSRRHSPKNGGQASLIVVSTHAFNQLHNARAQMNKKNVTSCACDIPVGNSKHKVCPLHGFHYRE